MQQHGLRADLLEQLFGGLLDLIAVREERLDQIVLAQRARAEVIFERLGGNRALHGPIVDARRKRQHQIAGAVFGHAGWKGYMHGDALKRMKCRDVSSLITQSTADLTYVKAAFRVISGGVVCRGRVGTKVIRPCASPNRIGVVASRGGVASCCGKRTEAA
ncbi:hypothetical protein QFZ97_001486 [Paraburkholderia youngii]